MSISGTRINYLNLICVRRLPYAGTLYAVRRRLLQLPCRKAVRDTFGTGVGVELDERLVAKARRNAAAAGGVPVEFRQGNFLEPKLDLHQATVM